MTPRAVVLLLALIAAACSRVPPEELSARYDLDRIRPEDSLPAPTDDSVPETTTVPDPEPVSEPHDVWPTECPFDADSMSVEVDCGYVALPGPEGSPRPTRLSFAHFHSSHRNPAPDPVIYLHGGPGGSILSVADAFYSAVVEPFISRRDVIMYDQRGGGESSPLPVCDDAFRFDPAFYLEDRDHDEVSVEYLEVLAECGRDLGDSFLYDLTAYNSVTHAGDTIELARALGFDEFNLHGSSYGTRLAQAVMRDHPEWVRAAVLTGFYPTEVNLIGSVPSSFESALQTVFDACAADPTCGPALPDPWATLDDVVARFDASPVEYESPYFDTPVLIDDDEIINGLHGLLYSADAAAMIPDALIDFRDDDLDRLTRIGAWSITDIGDVAGFIAVQCHEEAPFTTEDERDAANAIERAVDRVNLVPGFIGGGLLELCASWDTGTADPIADEPTVWTIPTLLFSGGFDPITPPSWASATADRLGHITHVHFPDRGHDADEGFCAVDMMRRFMDRPDDAVDTRCVEDELLQPNNAAARLVDQAGPSFIDAVFDTESGAGATWADIRVPDWAPYFIDDEDSYYRDDDWLDPTILVIRNGPFDVAELTWYLDGYFGDRFEDTETPGPFAGAWQRRLLERSGTDMVAYIHSDDPMITVALVAESNELGALERTIVFPVLESFGFS